MYLQRNLINTVVLIGVYTYNRITLRILHVITTIKLLYQVYIFRFVNFQLLHHMETFSDEDENVK